MIKVLYRSCVLWETVLAWSPFWAKLFVQKHLCLCWKLLSVLSVLLFYTAGVIPKSYFCKSQVGFKNTPRLKWAPQKSIGDCLFIAITALIRNIMESIFNNLFPQLNDPKNWLHPDSIWWNKLVSEFESIEFGSTLWIHKDIYLGVHCKKKSISIILKV